MKQKTKTKNGKKPSSFKRKQKEIQRARLEIKEIFNKTSDFQKNRERLVKTLWDCK